MVEKRTENTNLSNITLTSNRNSEPKRKKIKAIFPKSTTSSNVILKRREHSRAAAARTLRGDGCNPFLPPLPTKPGVAIATSVSYKNIKKNTNNLRRQHPYGVLPFGNKFISDQPDCRQFLGQNLSALNDEQIITILGFLDGYDLGKIVQSCRFLYVLGNIPDLWRDMMLRREEVITSFKASWRDTYVHAILMSTHSKKNHSGFLSYQHKPFVVHGLYSDALYRSYLCSTFHFDATHLRDPGNHVTQIPCLANHHLQNDPQYFIQNYEKKNKPCIITNVTESWPAYQKWNKMEYFTKSISEETVFRATSAAAPLPASFTIKAYFQYCSTFSDQNNCNHLSEEAPLYLFDRTFDVKAPHLLNDYQPYLHKSCPYFNPNIRSHNHDLFHVLGQSKRPDHRWIIMGPSNNHSGSAFHIDPNATHAWNAPLSSNPSTTESSSSSSLTHSHCKYWIFYPPGITPPGIHPSPNGDDVAMPISLGEWFLTYWDEHVRQRSNRDVSRRPLEGIVKPGEILFVPHGWWHLVLNLGSENYEDKNDDFSGKEMENNTVESDNGTCQNNDKKRMHFPCSIAVTQNYVSGRNLSDVLRFLKKRKQQISGCRDRSDAIAPDNLFDEFTSKIRKWDEKMWNVAQKQASQGWMCDAWNDDDHDKVNEEAIVNSKHETSDTFEKGSNIQKNKKLSILERAKLSISSDLCAENNETLCADSKFTFSFL